MSKKDAAVYLTAAELIETGEELYCCWAINRAVNGKSLEVSVECDKYAALYDRKITGDGAYGWFGSPYDELGKTERKHERVMSLCFAAAMAEAGDL